MAEIAILTDDTRLYRILTLLVLDCGHTVGATSPALVLTDMKDVPERLSSLPRLTVGEGGISRPFSHAEMCAHIKRIMAGGDVPLLTPTEQRLYDALLAASPSPVNRDTLSRLVFDTEEDGGRLNLYIHYLRKKIETDGVKRIFATRGKGYYYDASHTRR